MSQLLNAITAGNVQQVEAALYHSPVQYSLVSLQKALSNVRIWLGENPLNPEAMLRSNQSLFQSSESVSHVPGSYHAYKAIERMLQSAIQRHNDAQAARAQADINTPCSRDFGRMYGTIDPSFETRTTTKSLLRGFFKSKS